MKWLCVKVSQMGMSTLSAHHTAFSCGFVYGKEFQRDRWIGVHWRRRIVGVARLNGSGVLHDGLANVWDGYSRYQQSLSTSTTATHCFNSVCAPAGRALHN